MKNAQPDIFQLLDSKGVLLAIRECKGRSVASLVALTAVLVLMQPPLPLEPALPATSESTFLGLGAQGAWCVTGGSIATQIKRAALHALRENTAFQVRDLALLVLQVSFLTVRLFALLAQRELSTTPTSKPRAWIVPREP